MSSALGYYATQKRASDRLENKRSEISRASAYIIDSSSSSRTGGGSYSSYSSSNYGDSGRTGRARLRDSSTDYSAAGKHRHEAEHERHLWDVKQITQRMSDIHENSCKLGFIAFLLYSLQRLRLI